MTIAIVAGIIAVFIFFSVFRRAKAKEVTVLRDLRGEIKELEEDAK